MGYIWDVSFAQNFINYTEKDGLVDNRVYRSTQDENGFIWILTDKGISKFDGYSFKNFTVKNGLPVNDIWKIRITDDNKIWYFARSDELGYIENDSVYSFPSSNKEMMNPNAGINVSGNNVYIIGSEKGYYFEDNLWKESSGLLSGIKLLNKTVTLMRDSLQPNVFYLEDNSGCFDNLIFEPGMAHYQLNDSLFVSINQSSWKVVNLNDFTTVHGNFDHSELNVDPLIVVDFHWVNNGLQLFKNNGLICFDEYLEKMPMQIMPVELNAIHVFKDKQGFTWVSTLTQGIYKFPNNFDKIHFFFKRKASFNH